MRRDLMNGPFLLTTVTNFFFFSISRRTSCCRCTRALGGSEMMVGAVMGSSGLASIAVLPFVGLSIDRLGRRVFLLAGAIGMTAASVGFLFVDSVGPALFALRMLQGLSFAAAFTATTTFAAEFAPVSRRAQALGLFGLSTLLTHAIAPVLGEEIIRRWGFSALFTVSTAYTTIAVLLATQLPPASSTRGADAAPSARRLRPIHWIVAGTMTFAGMGFGTVMTFMPTYVTSEGLGRVGFFFAAYTTTAILTRLVGAGLSDTLGRRRVIMPALLALAASIFWIAFVRNVPVLFAAGALFGTAQGISYPTLHAFLVDLASEAQLGRSQALFNGAFNLGVTGSAFTFGAVAEHFGHRPMFIVASIAPVLACALFYFGTAPARVEVPA
jgi:MFS family permease